VVDGRAGPIALRRMFCPVASDGEPSSLVMSVHRLAEALLIKSVIHRYEPGNAEIAQARAFVLDPAR
jgi:hypothetical protein